MQARFDPEAPFTLVPAPASGSYRTARCDGDHLEDMAHYDALTTLPNRVLLLKRLGQLLRHMPHGRGLALLYLDLERFAQVNAALGYDCGDLLLQAVAERLQGCTRETDLVARIGNDEFAVFRQAADPVGEGAALARKILAALEEPVSLGRHQLAAGADIGIAVSPTHGSDAVELLRCAELAFSRLKADGERGYRFFKRQMGLSARIGHELEGDLRDAMKTGGLQLHFQPVFDLERNDVACCEALLRWTHPKLGVVPPKSFIGVAEATGQIAAIGQWVLREACAQAATWREDIGVAINLSAAQVAPSLVDTVAGVLKVSGLSPERIELEVTETVLLRKTSETLAVLQDLRALGVKIAMDDFGTGYSSLLYLSSFPFDKIKIDRSFVAGISRQDTKSVAVLRAAVALGTSLGMTTTAEGVETEEQLEIVRAEGCAQAQGYLLGRPKAAAAMGSLLLAGPQRIEDVPYRSRNAREKLSNTGRMM